jgi:hypothetical protein
MEQPAAAIVRIAIKRSAAVAVRTFKRYAHAQDVPATAVRLVLREVDGQVVADVEWPANTLTDGGNYLYPTDVPLAIERADDVCDHYGLTEVAVVTGDPHLWNPAWGYLSP